MVSFCDAYCEECEAQKICAVSFKKDNLSVRISDSRPVSSNTCSVQISFAGITGTMELAAAHFLTLSVNRSGKRTR